MEEMVGSCECGNEPLISIKYKEILEEMKIFYLPKNSVPWS
jgi:hypothetical protein